MVQQNTQAHGLPENREQALERIVGEMLVEGVDLTQKKLPELPVLNEKMFDAMTEADPNIEEPDYWDAVKAAELKEVAGKVKAAFEAKADDEEEGDSADGLPEMYPTTLYCPGKPSTVVDDEQQAERAMKSGFKCFDDFTVEEQREMHPMFD